MIVDHPDYSGYTGGGGTPPANPYGLPQRGGAAPSSGTIGIPSATPQGSTGNTGGNPYSGQPNKNTVTMLPNQDQIDPQTGKTIKNNAQGQYDTTGGFWGNDGSYRPPQQQADAYTSQQSPYPPSGWQPGSTYAGPYQNYGQPQNNTPSPYMFSSQNGPQAGAVGRGPENYAPAAPMSPALTQEYYQYLINQVGQGASPYGQQNVYNPSTGQFMQGGLTAPVNQQLWQGIGGINQGLGQTQNATPDINGLRSEYGGVGNYIGSLMGQAGSTYNPAAFSQAWNPLQQQSSLMAQYGGYGFPGQQESLTSQFGGTGFPGQQLGLQSQYGALGNSQDPYGLYTGAQSLQGLSSGQGFLGNPGQFLNSATQNGGSGQLGGVLQNFGGQGLLGGQGNQTLNQMAATGMPIDQTPQWQATVQAMQRNQAENQAQIAEHAAQSGNLAGSANGGGSSYNQAMTDYMTQANAQQNALLSQQQSQALEAARQRQMGAAGQIQQGQLGVLGQLGNTQAQAGMYGAGSQLTAADLQQRLMQSGLGQMNQNQQNAMGLMNQNQQYGLGQWGNQLSQQQTTPYQALGQLGNLGMQGLNAVSTSQQVPYGLFNQNQGVQQGWTNQAMGAGNNLQGLDQNAINTNYNEFLRTNPSYNPLLPYMNQAANTFPQQYPTQYMNNPLWGLLGSALGNSNLTSQIGKGIGAAAGALGGIFGNGFSGGLSPSANGGSYGGFGSFDPWGYSGSQGNSGYGNSFPGISSGFTDPSTWGSGPGGGDPYGGFPPDYFNGEF